MVHPKSGEPGLASDQFHARHEVEGFSPGHLAVEQEDRDGEQLCNPLQPGLSDLRLGAAK
jgi:hypothetical protein